VFHCVSGDLLCIFREHAHEVSELASLGGDIVASGDLVGWLHLWDASIGESLHSLRFRMMLGLAALSADRFVVSEGPDLRFYRHSNNAREVAELQVVKNAHATCITKIAASGALVVTASIDRTVAVRSADTFERLKLLDAISVLGIVMNEKRIVSLSRDSTMRVYDSETFDCHVVLTNADYRLPTVLLDDDNVLTTVIEGDDEFLRVTTLSTGRSAGRADTVFPPTRARVSQGGLIVVAWAFNVGSTAAPLPPPALAENVSVFKAPIAAMRRASCGRIDRLAKFVTDRLRG
jgi:WD40 repeat protein